MKRRPPRAAARVGFGPLVGLRDSLDPQVSNDPKFARVLQNMRPVELTGPTTFVGRPGFDKLLTNQITSGGDLVGQLVHHYVNADDEHHIIFAFGGSVFHYTCAADLATAVGSLDTYSNAVRMYAVTFNGDVIVSDGIRAPLSSTISGAGLASTNTMAAAPIFYGQPVVYYAKLFAIKAAERTVIVWSEENDATIGYETTPYSNSWELGQTGSEPLFALCATNEALYYFRARSIGAIRGAVTPEFTTDGTHEGISQSIGTTSPDGVCLGPGEKIYFISADGEPCVIAGGVVRNLADDCREMIRTLDKNKMAKAITRYNPTTGLVHFAAVEIGQEECSCSILVNAQTDTVVGVERGYVFSAMGIAKPGIGNATGIFAAPAANGTTVEPTVPTKVHLSTDGYVYIHGTPNGTIWNDYHQSGTLAIEHVIESCHLATDSSDEKRFTRADLTLRAEGAITGIQTYRTTPYGPSAILEGTVSDPREPEWGAFNWDEAPWAEDAAEAKLALGLNALGRWVRHTIVHQETGEQIGFTRMTTEYVPAGDLAGAR